MPEPGGSVQVTERSFSPLSWISVACAFLAWWFVFWAAWDRLLKGQIFGNTETGPASGDVVFILGVLLAVIGISVLGIALLIRVIASDRESE